MLQNIQATIKDIVFNLDQYQTKLINSIDSIHSISLDDFDTLEKRKNGVDEVKGYKDAMTDIVVSEFMNTIDTTINFATMVITLFEYGISLYIALHELQTTDIVFIAKGGNILRMIVKDFISEIPYLLRKQLDEYYGKYFKRSDNDYSIYINPKIQDWKKVYNDIVLLSIYIQCVIRKIMQEEPTRYFSLMRYNTKYATTILEKYLQSLNEIPELSDMNNTQLGGGKFTSLSIKTMSSTGFPIPYRYKPDRIITQKDGNIDIMTLCSDIDNFLTISCNTSIIVETPVGNQRFALARTKVIFNSELERNGTLKATLEGGELVDVTIIHKTDYLIDHFYHHIDQNIHAYTLVNDPVSISFKSYSLSYMISDLERILFIHNSIPWDDKKYTKRLYRLFYLYFIDIYTSESNNANRKRIYKNYLNVPQVFAMTSLAGYIKQTTDKSTSPEKLSEFNTVVSENIGFALQVLNNLDRACGMCEIMSKDDIYVSKVETFLYN